MNITAVDWLINRIGQYLEMNIEEGTMIIEQAVQMERDKRKEDLKLGYNQGYLDAQCNHINDAESFANEQDYLNESELPKEDKTFKQKLKCD